MPRLSLILPPLHKSQKIIALDPHRFIVVAAGRRWRKTSLGIVKCTEKGLQGKRAGYVAPTYPLGAPGWRFLKGLARQVPGSEIREVMRMVQFPGGGWAAVKSADNPDSLRGEGWDFTAIDETAHIPKFDEVWEQALRPALADRQGGAMFLSTPKGFNHFYELYKRAEQYDDWAAYQHPTWDNPFIAASEIEEARRLLPDLVFRQEFGAEFVQLAGALFKREWFRIIDEAPDIRYVRYWDLAASTKTSADYTAGGKAGLAQDGTLIIAGMARGRWEWPDALKVIGTTAKMDGSGVMQGVEDVGVQKGMYQMLMREPTLVGIGFSPIPVDKDKMKRVLPWLARAEQGKIALVRGEWNAAFIDEACAFPETEHDDQVDAVSGAVQMLSKAPAYWVV